MLVDTSVWVDHLRRGNKRLASLLLAGEVECHPFVIGELACGTMARRHEILAMLERLPRLPTAEHEEVLRFLEQRRLFGRGIGWIDVHLLASATLGRSSIWTLDRALSTIAGELGLAG
jgi:predicted nucleic acid-binding protein